MTHLQNWFYSIIIIYLNWDLNTGFVTIITQRMPLVEQEHLMFNSVFDGVRLAQSLIFDVVFCLSVWPFTFGNCIVCPSLVYGFWLPLYYFLTFLDKIRHNFSMIIIVLTIKPKLLDLVNAIEKLTKVNVELACLRWRKTKCIGYIL